MRRARIHRRSRSGSVATLGAGVLSLATGPLLASPTGGQVTVGNGQITQNGNQTTVTQQSQNLAIDWQSFNIGANQGVTFNQPGRSAIVLNEVVGQSASQILGSLKANGQVFILNPNGVLFGSGAQVSVGGLVAGTLGLNVSDFVAGKYDFFGNSSAAVSNAGNITAANGGYIALLGARVSNSGSLIAPLGSVSLAAGQQVTLQLANGSLLGLTVNQGALDALASNEGLIRANGGEVLLTAAAADTLTKAVVNNSGIIEAQSLDSHDGTIQLVGDVSGGTVDVSGTLDASNVSGGTGGQIDVFGSQVNLLGNAQLSANGVTGGGTIHVGGDFHGSVASENATSTYVADGVSINANATGNGNGGQVSVWSNEQTYMYGDINAMGGASGGNGGFVETSGKNYLDFRGKVDLLAAHGTTGTLLLDPYSLIIDDGTGSPDTSGAPSTTGTGAPLDTFTWGGPNTNSYVASSTINTALQTSDVLIQTGNSTGGSIVVAGSASLNWTTSNTLALSASSDILINSAIYGPAGTLELVSSGGSINQTAGPITVTSLAASAPTGTVNLSYPGNSVTNVAGTSGSGGFILSTSNAGGLVVTEVTGVVNPQTTGISSSGSTVTIAASGGPVSTSGATITASSLGVTANGNIGTTIAPLATAVQTLTADSATGGTVAISNTYSGTLTAVSIQAPDASGVYLKNTGALAIDQLPDTGIANVVLEAGTNLAVNGGIETGGTVDLEADNGNITQGSAGNITAPALAANAHGFVALTDTNNAVGAIAGTSSANFQLYDTGNLELLSIPALGVGSFKGLGGSGVSATAGNVTLATTGNFINTLGANALSAAGTAHRWLVYSTNPANDTDGGLSDSFVQYGASIHPAGSPVLTPVNGAATGNGFLYSLAPTLTVSLTGTIEKVYNGGTTAAPTQSNYVITGGVNGDAITLHDTSANYATKDVSTLSNPQPVTINGLSANATNGAVQVYGYQIANTGDTVSGNVGVIDPAPLVVVPESITKVYDGTTNATVPGGLLVGAGLQAGDLVTGTEVFGSKNVLGHNGSTLSVTGYTITDTNGNNVSEDYIAATQTATGTITPAPLTLTAGTYTKVYDTTTSAAGTVTSSAMYGSDTVTGATENFLSPNVLGTNHSTLTVTSGSYSVNDGNNGNNYAVSIVTSHGTITPAPLTLTTATDTKTYDGTTSAPGTTVGVVGLLGSDSIAGDVEAFTSKNVAGTNGSTLTVAPGYVISDGNGGKNYAVTVNTSTGTITPATLTLAAVTDTKTYDATTNATGVTLNVVGLQGSDTVTGLTESFGSRNVMGANGSTLSVNSGYAINDGNGGNNYTVATNTATGTITPAALTLSAATDSKTYDGTTSATGTTVGISGLHGSDSVSGLTESFDSKNVMGTNGSTLSVNSNYTLNDGNGGNNYTVTTDTATGTISAAPLTITANSASKPAYTPNPPFTATYIGLATGDSPRSLGGTLQFSTAATTKSSLGNYAIVPSGVSSGNYTIDFVDGILTIIPGAVTTAIEPGGAYDAAVTPADGLLGGSTPPTVQPAGPWLTVKGAGIALPPGVSEVE